MTRRVRVFAPATISNLGPGFDILGLALEGPGDLVEAELGEVPGVEIVDVSGDDGALSRKATENVAGVAAADVLRRVPLQGGAAGNRQSAQHLPGVRLWVHKHMPLASGLGSSGASSVAGAFSVNELFGRPFSRVELIASAMEGERVACGSPHADNVAPSMLGGIVLVRGYEPLEVVQLPVPGDLWVGVVHPRCVVSTAAARTLVRERQYAIAQVVTNLGSVGGFVSALYRNDLQLLGRSIRDELVEPVRAHLIPAFHEVKQAALAVGALGCSVAGAGPSMFAFADAQGKAQRIAAAMSMTFRSVARLDSDMYVGQVTAHGAKVIEATG